MNEVYFTEKKPELEFGKINRRTEESVRNMKVGTLEAGAIELLSPRASDFQELFDKLGLNTQLRAARYRRIILIQSNRYGLYNKHIRDESEEVIRFELGCYGVDESRDLLVELKNDLKFSLKNDILPWVVIAHNPLEEEVRSICERYIC